MGNITFKHILVPTDFSNLAENALRIAIAVCKTHGARITLLHVVDELAYLSPSEVFIPSVDRTPDVFATIEDNIKDLAFKMTKQSQVEIEGSVSTGNPADTICRVAAKDGCDMIVMGAHGASGVREFFIGSNAFRVIKHSSCPVLTIPGNWEKLYFNKVIYPVRLIPGALNKYDYTQPLIEKTNAEMMVIGLAENDNPGNMLELTSLVDQLKVKLQQDEVRFTTTLISAKDFAPKVLEAAEVYDADLIVITADFDLEWRDFIVGPFAQRIVNHSKRPVLSIAPERAKRRHIDFE
jgi:nucleotide-binding universal stress UspA family protein